MPEAKTAKKVKLSELSGKRVILGVHWVWNPFSEEEIELLTQKVSKFTLTSDGESLFVWGE